MPYSGIWRACTTQRYLLQEEGSSCLGPVSLACPLLELMGELASGTFWLRGGEVSGAEGSSTVRPTLGRQTLQVWALGPGRERRALLSLSVHSPGSWVSVCIRASSTP